MVGSELVFVYPVSFRKCHNAKLFFFSFKFKASAVWHFACMPFIWLCSAKCCFGAVRQTWCTSLCWCSWRCLTRLFKGQVRLLIRVPSSVFKSQHSGARIAHKSFKMLMMWIISCTKVTGHVTSWNARATVFIVIVFATRCRTAAQNLGRSWKEEHSWWRILHFWVSS